MTSLSPVSSLLFHLPLVVPSASPICSFAMLLSVDYQFSVRVIGARDSCVGATWTAPARGRAVDASSFLVVSPPLFLSRARLLLSLQDKEGSKGGKHWMVLRA